MEESKTDTEATFQNALDIFETLNQNFPSTTAAKVIGKRYNENGDLKSLTVKILFSKTNLQKFEARTHSNIYSVDVETGVSTLLNDIPIDEPTDKLIVMKSEKNNQRIIIRKDSKNEKQLYLEHWDKDGFSISLKLNNVSKIHNNSVFGGISWSKNCDKITFIAEREEVSEYSPYWDSENKKPKDSNAKGDEKKEIHISDKFKYNHQNSNIHSNYGETLADCKYTVIVVYDLTKKKSTILNLMKLKEDKKIDSDVFDDVHPAHPIFDESGNGLIFHGYHLPIDKLGLVFCIDKLTKIFYIKQYEEPEKPKSDSKEEKKDKEEIKEDQPKFKYDVNVLTSDYYFAGFPKFSDDYKYLAFFSTKEVFHTHCTSVALSVIENFDTPEMSIHTIIEREHGPSELFSGIYGESGNMQECKFIKNTHYLLLSTINKGKEISLLVDFSAKTYKIVEQPDLPEDTTNCVLLIDEDIILFRTDSIKERPSVTLVKGITTKSPEWIKIAQVDTQNKITERCKTINAQLHSIKIDTFNLENGSEGYFIRSQDHEANEESKTKKRPTILMIHGGPHFWALKNMFLKSRALWLCLGYNLCIVNYRGSGGYGLKFMESLSGHVFEYDVNDTVDLFSMCLEKFKDEIDETKLGIYGGSHGGFLTCSIISHIDWNEKFKAACIWNPVTAMHMSYMVSDIPDWHWSVALGKKNQWHASREDVLEMYDKSPINRTSNVKIPSLFIIGESDLRVPRYAGMQFYRAIKDNGVETELMYYSGQGHAVDAVEEGIDALMNMTKWFINHF